MIDTIFPPPEVLRKLHFLVKEDFTKFRQANYSETPQTVGTSLEDEVVRLLEYYSRKYNYRVHFHRDSIRGFAGLLHEFDAGIEDRDSLSQCFFEVKYRGSNKLIPEDIIKFHHSTFEYFLRLLRESSLDRAHIFRCFITNQDVSDDYRQFFYTWGIVLIDPFIRPLPSFSEILEICQKQYGSTDQLIELIERSNRLTEQAYFSLADLIPSSHIYTGHLDVGKLSPAASSIKILEEHRYLQEQVDALQREILKSQIS